MNRQASWLCGIALGALAMPAIAQLAPDASRPPSAKDAGLEEIVVTAQKREQNLQNVPVSVTTLNATQLANQRITEFTDLTRAAPSLTITQATTSPNSSIILRGIGTFAFSTGVEPSVAVIVDDMPVVQQAQAFDNLGDVSRIEVLKGPQGTLFGKNASAGVVNVVTADPTNRLAGHLTVSGATDHDVRVEGSISGPLTDSIGVLIGGYYHNYRGNIYNLDSRSWLNDEDARGVHAKLRARLSPSLTFTVSGSYAKSTQDGAATSLRSITPGSNPVFIGVPTLALRPSLTGITPGVDNYQTKVDVLGATSNKTATVSGRGVLNLGAVDLISITSYQDWKYFAQFDADATDLDVLGALTGGASHGGLVQAGPYHSTDLTQELRLVSARPGPLKFVAGGFYSDASTTRSFSRGPVILLSNWTGETTSRSLAAFAQVDYTLPTKTTLTGGVRVNNEKVGVAFDNLLATATPNTCAPGNPACRGNHTDTVVTWRGVVSQELADQVMAYGSIARGYKGYAFDVSSGFNPARINASLSGTGAGLVGAGIVKPEHSTSYEVGVKSRFLDNRLQLNVTGFLTDYSNFQAQSVIVVAGALQSVLNNVGKLRTKGVEVELSAKPASWLRLDGSAAYTDAVIRSFPIASAYSGQPGSAWNGTASALVGNCTTAPAATAANPATVCSLQDRSGGHLPNSPKFKFNLSATGEFPLAGRTKLITVASYQHQSSVNFDLLGNPLLVQGAYGVFNGSLGFDFGKITVTGFVNNLFDKHYAASLGDSFGSFGGSATNPAHVITQYYTRDSQRYFGIKAGYRF